MLSEISAATVAEIAALAREAREAQDLLLDKSKLSAETAEGQPLDEASDTFSALNASLDNEPLTRLKRRVEAIPAAEFQELQAIALVGRGEFTAKQWDEAMDRAVTMDFASDRDQLTEDPMLHDYLMKGLYELDLNPEWEA